MLKLNTTQKKLLLLTYIISILALYLGVLFFKLLILSPIFLIIQFVTVCIVLITMVMLYLQNNIKARFIYPLIAVVSLFLFVTFYTELVTTSEQIFFQLRKSKLEKVTHQILNSNIYKMNDATGVVIGLNGYVVTFDPQKIDTTSFWKTYPIDKVLDYYKIEKSDYDNLRQSLLDLDIKSFTRLNENEVSFTINCVLGNCTGLSYVQNDLFTGRWGIVYRRKLSKHWYFWFET